MKTYQINHETIVALLDLLATRTLRQAGDEDYLEDLNDDEVIAAYDQLKADLEGQGFEEENSRLATP